MKYLFYITALCITISGTLTAQWEKRTLPTSGSAFGVYFLDDMNGWVVGQGNTMHQTFDGGLNWISRSETLPTPTETFWSVHFHDLMTGFISGENGSLLKTTDGGNTWTKIATNTTEMFYDMVFTTPLKGYLASYGFILKTADGFATFDSIYVSQYATLQSIYFVNESVGYASSMMGSVYKTTDGGSTWNELNVGMNVGLSSVMFLTADVGWTAGSGYLFKTTDGGTNWSSVTVSETTYPLTKVHFVSADTGFVSTSTMDIFRTTDGGASWIRQYWHASKYQINDMHFFDSKIGWAVGQSGTYLRYWDLPVPVTAGFFGSPTEGNMPLSVQFINQSNGPVESYLWSFGDGSTSTESNPVHLFETAGTFTVTMIVSGGGTTDTLVMTDYITVTEAEPPVVDSFEPNNTFLSATAITGMADTLFASINPELDIDFYTFNGVIGDTLDVYTWNADDAGLDGEIQLFGPDKMLITFNDDYNSTADSRITQILTMTGPHYIRYAHYANDDAMYGTRPNVKSAETVLQTNAATGTYFMSVLRYNGSFEPPPPVTDSYFATAPNLTFGESHDGTTSDAQIHIYKFTVPDEGFFESFINGGDIFSDVSIIHPDTVTIITTYEFDSEGGFFHTHGFPAAGTYYVKMTGKSSASYSLSASFNPASLPPEPKPNDHFINAIPIYTPTGSNSSGRLGFYQPHAYALDSVDIWSFSDTNNLHILFRINMDSVDILGDRFQLAAEMYNGDTVTVFSVDQSTDDTQLIVDEYLQPGTYYVKIMNKGNNAGSFDMNIASAGFSQDPQDSEPNDLMAAASLLPIATPIWAHLGHIGNDRIIRDQTDWWTVTVPSTGMLTVHAERVLIGGFYELPTAIDLEMFSQDSVMIESGADYDDTDKNYTVAAALPAGTYFIRVRNNENYAAYYNIEATFSPTVTPVDPEPNDYWIDAGTMELNGIANGSVGFLLGSITDNFDLWKVTVPGHGNLSLSLHFDSLQQNGSRVHISMELWDTDTTIYLVNDASEDDTQLFITKNLKPGTYHIKVTAHSSAGLYSMANVFNPAFRATDPEPNDSPVHAAVIDVQSPVYGLIGYYGSGATDDADWWIFSPPFDDSMFVTVICDLPMNILVELYDSTQQLLSFGYTDSTITRSLNAAEGKPYFVKITPLAYQSGSYSILVNTKKIIDKTPPDVPIHFSAHAVVRGITCRWDAVAAPDLHGYKLYYGYTDSMYLFGTGAAEGDSPVFTADTSLTLTGLNPSTNYIVTVTAIDTAGNESGFSLLMFVTPEDGIVLPAVTINNIWDVPNDNGRQVFVSWMTSAPASSSGIGTFAVWYWYGDSSRWINMKEHIQSVNDTLHTVIVPTLYDSTIADGMRYSVFKITAHGINPGEFVMSKPDSGYSLDNVLPMMPDSVIVTPLNNVIMISWLKNTDEDLKYYVVYRDTAETFVPAETNRIGVTVAASYTDSLAASDRQYYYRITAVDWSGNQSPASKAVSGKITTVSDTQMLPSSFALMQNYPNPFNPATTIRFALPIRSVVTITVYNVLGQTVAVLTNGIEEAGVREVQWHPVVPSGLYFYRLEASSCDDPDKTYKETRKMLFVK
ncbi:MAG: YCF48-related protein [Bacteroidota bacterium]